MRPHYSHDGGCSKMTSLHSRVMSQLVISWLVLICEMSCVLGQLQNKRLGAAYNLWLCLCSQQSWWKERLVTVTSPGIFHFYLMCPPSTINTHWQLLSAEPLHYCTVAVDNNPRPRTHIIMGTPMPNKFLFFWPGLESNIVFPTTPGHLIQFLLDEISWNK